MTQIKRKIHVIGINSFEFKELPLKLQKLFIKTENIAVPDHILKILNYGPQVIQKKKNYFSLAEVTIN